MSWLFLNQKTTYEQKRNDKKDSWVVVVYVHDVIVMRYSFGSGRKLFGLPQAGRISRHFFYKGKIWRGKVGEIHEQP